MSTGGEKGSTTTKTPADFLKSIRGRPVVVKLNSGVDYRGWLLFLLLHLCLMLHFKSFRDCYIGSARIRIKTNHECPVYLVI